MSKSRRQKNKKAIEASKAGGAAVGKQAEKQAMPAVAAESFDSGQASVDSSQADAANPSIESGPEHVSADMGSLEHGEVEQTSSVQEDVDQAGSEQDASAQSSRHDAHAAIFSLDEMSAMDAQLSTLDVPELAATAHRDTVVADIEPIEASAVETESGWIQDVGTVIDTVAAPEIEPEPMVVAASTTENRRGKKRGKHVEPAAEPEGPLTPRTPAFEQLGEYERLSMAHIAGTPQQSDAPGHWRGVGFRLGQRRLAAGFDEIVEILSMPQVTHVPGAQPWMLGVANVRGTLLPVVDLKQFLEGERTVIHEAQRILVVRQGGGNVAVLIDELFGQRSFNDAQMITADEETGRYGYFVKQVYRVGDFDWGVFSMSMLTRTPEFRQAAA